MDLARCRNELSEHVIAWETNWSFGKAHSHDEPHWFACRAEQSKKRR